MSSSSTTLLQKILISKLEPWINYINGENKSIYAIGQEPDRIVINECMNQAHESCWLFPAATLIFSDDTQIKITLRNSKDVTIPYADPKFYKNVFNALDKAIAYTGTWYVY